MNANVINILFITILLLDIDKNFVGNFGKIKNMFYEIQGIWCKNNFVVTIPNIKITIYYTILITHRTLKNIQELLDC